MNIETSTNHKSKRIFYYDALRALAIISVIIFHASNFFTYAMGADLFAQVPLLRNWLGVDVGIVVFRCGVPLFFMLSGALLLGRNWSISSFLKKRIPRITIPFIFWSIILFLTAIFLVSIYPPAANVLQLKSFNLSFLGGYFYNLFMANLSITRPFWFFWTILGIYLILPVFNKWVCNSSLKETEYFLVIWLITCLCDYTIGIPCPVELKYFGGFLGFVILGYYLANTKRKLLNNKYFGLILIILSSIVAICVSYLISTPVTPKMLDECNLLLILGAMGWFLLFKNFNKFNIKSKFLSDDNGIFRKSVVSIAKYSYGIYLIHKIILLLLARKVSLIFDPIITIILVTIITLIISWMIMAIADRIPYMDNLIGVK